MSVTARASIAVIVLIGLFVAGCASPPPRKTPDLNVDMPAAWTSPGSTAELIERYDVSWWRAFGLLELDSVVGEALAYNYDLKAAVARVDQASALARLAGADLLPQLNASGNASRRKQNLIGIPIPNSDGVITTRTNSFGVSLDASWEIDLWGRVRTAKSAALADAQATWADLGALRLSIAGQAAKAWFAVMESRLQVELAEQTVESFKLGAEQVRTRFEQGVRSSLDLRLALANLHGAEALLETRRQVLDGTVRQLEILLGRYPSGNLIAQGDLPAVASDVPPGLPSEVLIRRPDLLAAERRFAAAERRVSQARRAFFPRISLTGSAGTLSDDLGDLLDLDFGVWSIAAGITQPIFQGGRLWANYSQSTAIADQALAQYASSLLRAFGEVETALYAEEVLERREEWTRLAAEQSIAAEDLAGRQYDAGIINYITVLETQRRALESQSQLLGVRRARLDARVNLHLALGGGFNLNEEWMTFLEQQDERAEGQSE